MDYVKNTLLNSSSADLAVKMENFAAKFSGTIRQNAPMSEYTSWRIGGAADWLLEPASFDDVIMVLDFAQTNNVPLTIIGRGTNLLVSDNGIAGLVLRIGEALSQVDIWQEGEEYLVKAQCGALLAALSRQTAEAGLSGLEWACGIPGNLGGALMMNAGAYGSSIGEYVTEVEAVAYRSGCLAQDMVALSVTLRLQSGEREAACKRIGEILTSRRQNQPLEYPSAGSVFRNPENSHAGYLIEQAGCKGLTYGGAQVSEKHGNFIINLGGATAADVLQLIEQVRTIVAEKSGYVLETEVRLLGRKAE